MIYDSVLMHFLSLLILRFTREVVELYFHARKQTMALMWCQWHANADELSSICMKSLPNPVR